MPTGSLRSVSPVVAVVIPSYKVCNHILDVISRIGPEASRIFVVDDHCPDNSGEFTKRHCRDPRVTVIRHASNQGVGGSVMTGYRAAIEAGAEIIVKIDGDGQMAPELICDIVAPIARGDADYTKGNRFFNLEQIHTMPGIRLFGNAVLSFLTKISSGYWDLFDPTNGYTAIHSGVARLLPFEKISQRYFFETDMLFRLNTLRAVVVDVPMDARYADEVSHLKVRDVAGEFLVKHVRNFIKRVFYNYYLRDMSLASLELPFGLALLAFGTLFGAVHWIGGWISGAPSTAGTVMISALPVIMGMQLLLAFIGHDVASRPQRPLQSLRQQGKHP
jgi:glycosyltransferase involved in cell wall biosynthesis